MDYRKRLIEHNSQELKSTFTSKHRPWILMALFECPDKSYATQVERYIKRQKSRRLIEKLIDKSFVPNGKLSFMVRVPHMRD